MNRNDNTVIVAADGGGTGCRVAVGTLAQGMLGQASGGPANVDNDFDAAIANLKQTVTQALNAAGFADVAMNRITAHFGVAGAHSEVEMRAVQDQMPYGVTNVTGDRNTSVRGVLGEADGFVMAVGTGTIVARQQNLHMRTMGGWGFDLSDQASGAWLGKRVLQEALLANDGFRAHTDLSRQALAHHGGHVAAIYFARQATPYDFAKIGRSVVEAATAGDPLGREIMAEGAAFLTAALKALGFEQNSALALTGGVGPHYASYLSDLFTANLVQPKGTALDGAFALASAAAQG